MHRIALVPIALACSLPALAQNAFSGTVTRIEQGDQVVVQLDRWQLTARLHGVDCPNDGPFAALAQRWTTARLLHKKVAVQVRGTAAKGVIYADVLYPPHESNVAIELVEMGLATWERRYAPDRRDLAAAEARARKEKAGFWGDPKVEVAHLTRLVGTLVPARPKAPPTIAPTTSTPARPTPTPPPASPTPAPVPTQPAAPVIPIVLSLIASAALLTLAERISRDARRLRERPTLLTDARPHERIKARGVTRPTAPLVRSVTGNIPAIYLREVNQTYRETGWQTTYDETDVVPFEIDDGLDQALVVVDQAVFKPIRVARFYNDVPVDHWHTHFYSGDVRTELFFIPPDVTVTVYGLFESEPNRITSPAESAFPLTVVEGDERRLTRVPTQVAFGLVLTALSLLGFGLWLTVSGGR